MTEPTNVHVIPAKWLWDEAALEYADMFGVPYEIVEAAAAHPTTSTLDPHSADAGWEIRRHRRGDVVAIVGYRDPARPVILHCRVITPGEPYRGHRSNAGSGGGSNDPKSWRQFRMQVIREGFRIVPGGKHDRIEAPNGDFITSIPLSASDIRAVPNKWHEYVNRANAWRTRQRVARGDLLHQEDVPE